MGMVMVMRFPKLFDITKNALKLVIIIPGCLQLLEILEILIYSPPGNFCVKC